ncbi:protoporphyrinogen oxidase [Cytophaga hutchinsonii]|uniref:Coproporphyrinogen III oxidase n=1 Tax=Cytophaga hutchinsonii (strain ATCC 33406 / DSM 1761 / CIP 103989 / NBRC 15051 / NCIMB 9469 / D465) TaxID=269798 RepID=A0A6N4SR35_CYTH3|nr:protoporphyrinogen oxidase [Cytophaga hutchinsonii]ABG58845.1 protoporphyrinogen oxidase [Cytophaga hutchinsonii ATCC 33406]SFX80487.1 oxygen-dependent protoporphyrinogen oxidase [Cytophaga hutchinsonii ATCC 33406]
MIAIIGAGISGLTLAYQLQQAGKPYILFESNSRPGGYINSQRFGKYLLEVGPNSILVDKKLEEFIHELNLDKLFEPAAIINKNRFIYKDANIQQVPSGPLSFLTGRFFSAKTKYAIFKELFNKSISKENETVYDFFARRFSAPFTQYTIDPFATGVYAGDIKQLLIEETFPQLVELEKQYGSIIKGIFKKGFGEKRKTGTFVHGLQTLTDTLAAQLHSLQLNTRVLNLRKQMDKIVLTTDTKHGIEELTFDKVVVCGTTFQAATLIKDSYPDLSAILSQVQYASMKAVFAAFKRTDVTHPMNGFGCLYPSAEQSFLAGTIWNSSIFNDRCPADEVLTTSFIGGMHHPEYTALSESELEQRAIQQLSKDLGITGKPTFTHVAGWNKAIPQYDIYLKKARLASKLLSDDHIYFRSNWTNGISLGNCIQSARDLALIL